MLTDNGDNVNAIVDQFYQQPIIKYLGESNAKKPSYLSSKSFATALVHLCNDLGSDSEKEQKVLDGIQKIKEVNPQTGKYLEVLYNDASGRLEEFQSAAENWFNETMDRATGWYKNKPKNNFLVAFVVALSFNVDTIGIVKNLSANPKLAIQVVEMADKYAKATKTNSNNTSDKEAEEQIKESLTKAQQLVASNSNIQNANSILGLGWEENSETPFLLSVLGCALTALAISLGAPFWFDLLNKMMQLRGSKKLRRQLQNSNIPSM